MVGRVNVSEQKTAAQLRFARQELTSALDALRDLLIRIAPHVELLDSPDRIKEVLDEHVPELSRAERRELGQC